MPSCQSRCHEYWPHWGMARIVRWAANGGDFLAVFTLSRIVQMLTVGAGLYAVMRIVDDAGAESDRLRELVDDARERVGQETRVPSAAGIGALGEIARVTDAR
jgi:hypothetical protein